MFVNKPVRFDQVYNAIASVCRRMTMRSDRSASWALDGRRAQFVSPTGSVVDLTAIELMILQRLCADMTTPVSRQDLAEAAGLVQSVDDRNLDSAIFRLRRKIESVTNQPSPLKTLHGFGYQVTEAVEVVDKPDAV
jgi:DNA-binding response OmpR family regulator